MPVTSKIDSARRFAVLTIADPYTLDEWRTTLLGVFADHVFRQSRALLVDRRGAAALTTATVNAMMQFFLSHRNELAIRAAIVARDAAGYGMGRMTEMKSEFDLPQTTIRTFRDYQEAVRWLTSEITGE
jgi:hypothetical protein